MKNSKGEHGFFEIEWLGPCGIFLISMKLSDVAGETEANGAEWQVSKGFPFKTSQPGLS